MRVYLPGDWNDRELELLSGNLSCDVHLLTDPSSRDFHVLVAGRPTEEMIGASSCLQSLIIPWAGVPSATLALMRNYPGISVHNLHHNASSASELAIGLMLAAARSIPLADSRLRKGDWSSRLQQEHSVLVSGSRVLIIGYGHIGMAVGRVCEAMGARVTGIRRSALHGDRDGHILIFPPADIPALLPETDILFLSLPLTEETKGFIGKDELELLHDRSLIINIGRGELVDEEALYSSLKERHIGGAGIDVWFCYPANRDSYCNTQPSSYPFGDLNNVVMTPHLGGAFGLARLERDRMTSLAESLNQAAAGKEIPCRVDLDRGY